MNRVISFGVDSPHFPAENCQFLPISFKVIQGVFFSLAVASCAQNCPPPKVVTQVVKEPVAVACIDASAIPPEPGTVALPLDARLAADLAASQAKDLRVWGRKLVALIGPCTK